MASNVIALVFEGKSTAEDMLTLFEDLQEQGVLVLEDAAFAARGPSGQVDIKQSQSFTGKYALGGSAVGLLAGLLLGGPIGGLLAGATVGAVSGAHKDVGIDDKFIDDVGAALGPNSSALFLMGQVTDRDTFDEQLRPFKARVLSTTLSDEQMKELKSILSREE